MSVQLLNAAYHAIGAVDLDPLVRLTLTTLAWRAEETGVVRLSRSTIGRQIGTDKRNAIRCVNALKAAGLVQQGEPITLDVPALLKFARRDAGCYSDTAPGVTVTQPRCQDNTAPGVMVTPARCYSDTVPGVMVTPIETNKTSKTTHTPPAGACVREETPTPSGLPEAAMPHDAESFQVFHRSYPQHRASADVRLLMSLWRQAEDAIGGDDAGARLLACLTLAKRSKRWQDEGGTYVSREDNFLSGHYSQYLADSKQEVRNAAAANRQRSQAESDIAFFAQLDAEINAEDAAARRRVQIEDICDKLAGGTPKTWEEKARWQALLPRAEELYEQGKRDGTLKPLVLACDLARGVTA